MEGLGAIPLFIYTSAKPYVTALKDNFVYCFGKGIHISPIMFQVSCGNKYCCSQQKAQTASHPNAHTGLILKGLM